MSDNEKIKQYVLDIDGITEEALTDRQTDRQTGAVI